MFAQTRAFFSDDQDKDPDGAAAPLNTFQDERGADLNLEIKFLPGSSWEGVRPHLKWCVYARCCFTRWASEQEKQSREEQQV